MTIGFEAKRIFTNFTGLGNYGRFVIQSLNEAFSDRHQLMLFTPTVIPHPDVDHLLSQPAVSTVLPGRWFKALGLGSLWRSWGMSTTAEMKSLDVFHGLSQELPFGLPRGIKKVVSVHDLIFCRYPHFYNPFDVSIYKAKARAACRQADTVIAISEQTAADLVTYLNIPAKKVQVVYQGCHASFRRPVSEQEVRHVKEKYQLGDAYMLQLGAAEERKNALLTVRAMTWIPRENRVPLVLVGKPGPYLRPLKRWINENELSPWVKFIDRVSFEDLPALYKGAMLFIYPSWFEGFGIPLVEAIEVGVPVIAAHGSSLKEAAGPDAVYVHPGEPQEMADKISFLTSHPLARKSQVDRQKKHTEQFLPRHIARRLEQIYQAPAPSSPHL